MQTRSQTRKLLTTKRPLSVKTYSPNPNHLGKSEVYINFDEASAAWKANKKSIGNGSYKYICCVDKNGKKCGIKCLMGEMYCRTHYKKFINPIHK